MSSTNARERTRCSLLIGGTVKLASADPFEFPTIDPKFLSAPFDQFAMVEAVKTARRYVETSPWDGYILGRFGIAANASTDAEILAAARKEVVTIWHPCCTASMSPSHASWGVVDPSLRVKGAVGLRVADASVMVCISSSFLVPRAHNA